MKRVRSVEDLNRVYRGRGGLKFIVNGECWDWSGKNKAPVRIVWAKVHGPIPPLPDHVIKKRLDGERTVRSYSVCHTCDRQKCGRPKHLFLGTSQDNSLDASRKRRLTWNRSGHQSAMARRYWSMPGVRTARSEAMRRAWADPVERAKREHGLRTSPRSRRSQAKLGYYWKGRKRSAETRRRMSKPKSEAHRRHISEGQRRAFLERNGHA